MHAVNHESPHNDHAQDEAEPKSGSTKLPLRPLLMADAPAAGVVVFWAALLVYLLTLAPDITWAHASADGGELIAASVTLGVPHPPGYPLYTLLGKLISFIPVGSIAYRFNLLSAVCMAAAAGFVAFTGAALYRANNRGEVQVETPNLPARTGSSLWVGACAGALFAFSPWVWQQAIIAEVYALNMLAVCSLLALLLGRAPSIRSGLIAGLLQGVAITTHLSSLLLLPAGLVTVRPRRWFLLPIGIVLGLLPFGLLPLFASSDSPVVWGEPQTLAGWWWVVTARVYHPNILSFPIERWAVHLTAWLSEPSFWLAAVMLLFIYLRRSTWRQNRRRSVQGSVLAVTAGLYILYAFSYDAHDAQVLTLPALAILVILAVSCLPRSTPWLLLLPLALLVLNFRGIDLSEYGTARALAESALREAPPNSIVLTSGDRTTFTLWYLQYAEGQREDLILIDEDLLAFDWYRRRLSIANPALQGLERDNRAVLRQLNENSRPWCELKFELDRIDHFWCKEPA